MVWALSLFLSHSLSQIFYLFLYLSLSLSLSLSFFLSLAPSLSHTSHTYHIPHPHPLLSLSLQTLQLTNTQTLSIDDVRMASSYALGTLAVGSAETHLPYLLKLIADEKEYRYYLLRSLRAMITGHVSKNQGEALEPLIATIIPPLFEHAESKDDAVRTMVSECLGKLSQVDPEEVFPRLLSLVDSDKTSLRCVVAMAVKYSLGSNKVVPSLQGVLDRFLPLTDDSDLVCFLFIFLLLFLFYAFL